MEIIEIKHPQTQYTPAYTILRSNGEFINKYFVYELTWLRDGQSYIYIGYSTNMLNVRQILLYSSRLNKKTKALKQMNNATDITVSITYGGLGKYQAFKTKTKLIETYAKSTTYIPTNEKLGNKHTKAPPRPPVKPGDLERYWLESTNLKTQTKLVHPGVQAAARDLKCNPSNISKVLNGKLKRTKHYSFRRLARVETDKKTTN